MSFHSYRGRAFRVARDTPVLIDDLRTITGSLRLGTDVRVSAVRVGSGRTFALVEAQVAGAPRGWILARDIEGGLVGETIGLGPGDWDVEPDGQRFTVTDPKALVRGGAPSFTSVGRLIPVGTFVRVVERSPAGSFVRVLRGTMVGGVATDAEEIGWTASTNLTPGWSSHLTDDVWNDPKGPNACWEAGTYLGPRVLVRIVGVRSEIEALTIDALAPYRALEAAAAAAGIRLAVESGFRTFRHQEALFAAFQADPKNNAQAARPGRSNHQNGVALDLNTGGFTTPTYLWLTANATAFGFIRTVSKEHWHWEFQPTEAAALRAQGRSARAGVSP